jgi:predicted nucleotidyltransferase
MIDVNAWMEQFLQALHKTFSGRIWFVGLQGSYARGEATEHSDIDTVLILDELNPQDIQSYHAMLDSLPHRELVCGFLSGKTELLHWEPSDLFQFCHDTKPIQGSLEEVLSVIVPSDVNRAIRIGACNIYHGCVHNMLYEKSDDILRGLYKSASFVLQAICYQQTGNYIRQQKDLLPFLAAEDRKIAEIFLSLKRGGAADFQAMSEALFSWAKNWILKTK